MARLVSVVFLVSLCGVVNLSARQFPEGPLRQSINRVVTHQSSDISATAPHAERSASWDRVRQLKPGAKVRITTREGRSLTGSFIVASEDALSTDKGARYRDEIISVWLVPGGQGLGVVGYAVIGAIAGGVLGYVVGSASVDCLSCGERGLAAAGGLVHGAWSGAMGGFVAGEVVHHRPERLVYARVFP